MWQQALSYQSSSDPASANLANDILRGSTASAQTMINMIASFPGITDPPVTITLGDGSTALDQTAIVDEAILGQVQSNWQTIANLFYIQPLTPPATLVVPPAATPPADG